MKKIVKLSIPVILSFSILITCFGISQGPQQAIEQYLELYTLENDTSFNNYPACKEFFSMIYNNADYKIQDCTIQDNTAIVTVDITCLNIASVSKYIQNEILKAMIKHPVDSLINYGLDREMGLAEGVFSRINSTIMNNIPSTPITTTLDINLVKEDGVWELTNPSLIDDTLMGGIFDFNTSGLNNNVDSQDVTSQTTP